MDCATPIDQIVGLVEGYFEGLYRADSDILRPLFHNDARYVNTVSGDYMNYSLKDYLLLIDQRTAPAASNQTRIERIISIEHDGRNMAFVKLSMVMLNRQFLDYLTLVFANQRWQIISKVFSYQPEQGN
jgi:hypothetical protein